jgi:integrase/recombinase XerD
MLIADFERYLALRRSLGFKLERVAEYLASFARFATAKGERHIRTQTAIEWAQTAPTPNTRYSRLRDITRAARFLHVEDPAHEIPPTDFFVMSKNKLIPYIFTSGDLARLLEAAVELQRHEHHAVQRQRYAMLFGLIAATGLRITEALNLQLGDVLSGGILHIREAKFGKSRLVPLHPTVQAALERYLVLRRDFVGLVDSLFLSARGRRLSYPVANKAFRDIIRLADIAPGRPRQPRIHDLRHSFATRVLEQCGTGRETVARHAVALMTYIGHTDLRYTYWYLQATPELMTDIAAAAEALVAGEVR